MGDDGFSDSGVKFGVAPSLHPIEVMYEVAILADRAGIDGVMLADHTVSWGITRLHALDAWCALSALAVKTSSVRLGTCVSDPYRRHPETLAQMVSTLDIISRGRAILGVGAGEPMNLDPYGIEWNHPVDRLREAIEVIKELWTREVIDYKGRYYHFERAAITEKPLQRPHPPIWVGSNSPKSLRITGELGDGWLPMGVTPEKYGRDLEKVMEGAKRSGRDPEEIVPAVFLYTGSWRDEEGVRKIFGLPFKLLMASSTSWIERLGMKPLPPEFDRRHLAFLPENTKGTRIREITKVAEGIPYESVEDNFLVGTPDKCIEGIERYIKAGARYILLVPYTTAERFKKAFEFYLKNVISHFQPIKI